MASFLSDSVIIVQVTVYIPSTADVNHKVEENGWVETQNICVKKLIVPPKNVPCFDAHKEWPKVVPIGKFKNQKWRSSFCF